MQVINAVAPIRICDIGGWTDTWFAKFGYVFNIAVYPYVEVQIKVNENIEVKNRILIDLENYGDQYIFSPATKVKGSFGETISFRPTDAESGKYPLIETSLDVLNFRKDCGLEINIYSAAPPGASTGTSAAVSVALIGALNKLMEDRMTAHEVAMFAHSIETQYMGLQCGVQDQLASAYGGINAIQINDFPHAIVSPINIADNVWWELEQRLCVIYMGKPHKSSEVHRAVIEKMGTNSHFNDNIEELRCLAKKAKTNVLNGNLDGLGDIMNRNTEVQRKMHPDLVCQKAEETIAMAKDFNAVGCKVNGAGGDGGSLTIMFGQNHSDKRKFIAEIKRKGEVFNLPIYLSRKGLRVW